jgi:RHS repeat-associated protein
VTSETSAAVDFLFAFTGRERDEESGLQFNRARCYDPGVGRWISEDPIGFAAGDANLSRYVGNYPSIVSDAFGLADGWEWNWHHLLDKAIFTDSFLKDHGLQFEIDIHSKEYGWMLRAKDHTYTGGIHPQGWSKDWIKWIQEHEDKGTKITKAMIDEQVTKMKVKYRLTELGFPAKYGYDLAQEAYSAAQHMALEADKAAKLATKTTGKAKPKGTKASKLVKIPIVGTVIGFFAGVAFGDEDALINVLEPIGFGSTKMGNAEWTDWHRMQYTLDTWDRYQQELNRQQFERTLLQDFPTLEGLVNEALRAGPLPAPHCNPSRADLLTPPEIRR